MLFYFHSPKWKTAAKTLNLERAILDPLAVAVSCKLSSGNTYI